MRFIKRFLLSLLILLVVSAVLMLMPRGYSVLFPAKPPAGYHFLWSSYLAIATGLEDLIETDPALPGDIEAFQNIQYKKVDSVSLELDIYKPKDIASDAPLLIFLHGGGWRKGHRGDMLPLIVDFSKRGYITATVSYRLRRPYPECVEDVSDAVEWFFTHSGDYGYDPDRIALVGASAGAHLAMMAGYGWRENADADSASHNHRIKAIVNIFGPVDMTTDFARNQPLAQSFMGRPYEEIPEVWREASPIRYVDNDSPPTMTLHGTSDELVPVAQADQLKHKLDSLGVPCVDYRFPLWPHAMILVQRVYDYCVPKMDEFLQQYLVRTDERYLPVRQSEL